MKPLKSNKVSVELLPIRQLSRIIRECRKNRVLTLEYQGLKLVLEPLEQGMEAETAKIYANVSTPEASPDLPETPTRLEHLDYLRAADPEAYERALLDDGFNDEGN